MAEESKTKNALIHVKGTPNSIEPVTSETPRKSFFRTIGVWLGLIRDYTAEDINRLKEAGVRKVEAHARETHGKADAQVAQAIKLTAEAEKARAEGQAALLKAEGERAEAIARASERLLIAISNIRQQGGSVAFDERQLISLLDSGRAEFPEDHGDTLEVPPSIEPPQDDENT